MSAHLSLAAPIPRINALFPASGVAIGNGWDVLRGQRTTGSCVTGSKELYSGNSSVSEFNWIHDDEDLVIKASMSTSGEASLGDFGAKSTFSMDGSLRRFKSTTNILSTTVVEKGGILWQPVSPDGRVMLKPNLEKIRQSDETLFKSICGDGYVSAIRYGGRLNVLFEIKKTINDFKMRAKYESAASFMKVMSGKVGAEASSDKLINESVLSVRTVQSGGRLATPISADSATGLIESYPNFAEHSPHPFEIQITPYAELGSDGVQTDEVDTVQRLTWTVARLKSLSLEYSTAAINPRIYYQPFYINAKSLEQAAAILRATVACGDALEEVCRTGRGCNRASVDKHFESYASCRLPGLSIGDSQLVRALLVRQDSQDAMFSNKKKLATGVSSEQQGGGTTEQNAAAFAEQIPDVLQSYDLGALYYYFYVRAPLSKQPFDELAYIKGFCENIYTDCDKYFANEVLKTPNYINESDNPSEPQKLTISVIHEWLLIDKLLPISKDFCAVSVTHSMCYTPEQLKSIVQTVGVFFGPDNGFGAYSPPPAPKPSKPVPIEIPCQHFRPNKC